MPSEREIRDLADALYRPRRLEFLPLGRARSDLDGLAPRSQRPDPSATGSATTKGCSSTSSRSARRTHPGAGGPVGAMDSAAIRSSGAARGRRAHVAFAPLFGHQYSHIWIDFRGIRMRSMRTAGFDYFENSRRATYANRAYCTANPMALGRLFRECLGAHRMRRARRFPETVQGQTCDNSTAIPRGVR